MKIAVIGTGMVGKALAKGFKGAGHEVRIGSRSGKSHADFSQETGIAEGAFADVASFGDVVVLAVKGGVVEGVAKELESVLAGKTVIDTTNPVGGPPENGVVPYFTGPNDSLIQRVQKAAPRAKVVKAFNSVGSALMVKPALKGGTPSMFLCGDDAGAKETVANLARELGWNPEDCGPAAMGPAVEGLCQIWCYSGFKNNDWAHAFAMLR
jgi:predicted dinucleotide-binding enzyme